MVGCKILLRKESSAEWVSSLLGSKFFDSCLDHGELRKNEKNLFCIDCNRCFCKHCIVSKSYNCPHRLLQICKYVYHYVVRLHDFQKHFDCSFIQTYKINGEKAVHLNPRPQLKDTKNPKAKGSGTCCEACGRHIQDLPNRFCSIACKVFLDTKITINQSKSNKISKPMISTKDRHRLPNAEAEENSFENRYDSSSPSPSESASSEVIQAWVNSALRPKKTVHKRKGLPRRAPMC